MTALQTLKKELHRIQKAQAACIDDNNIIRSCFRYKYQMLVRKAAEFRKSIEWLEAKTGCV